MGEGAVETTKQSAGEQYRLLAEEADHRLLNNLQTIASYLSLQRRSCTSPEVASQLVSAAQRVLALQKVHRSLRSASRHSQVELKALLCELAADYVEAFGAEKGQGFRVSVTGDQATVSAFQATALATMANELLLNAIKHGTGAISVILSVRLGILSLSVSNEGPALPAEFEIGGSSGSGMAIIAGLVRNLGASLEVCHGGPSHGPKFAVSVATDSA